MFDKIQKFPIVPGLTPRDPRKYKSTSDFSSAGQGLFRRTGKCKLHWRVRIKSHWQVCSHWRVRRQTSHTGKCVSTYNSIKMALSWRGCDWLIATLASDHSLNGQEAEPSQLYHDVGLYIQNSSLDQLLGCLDVYIKSQGGADLEISSGAETGADIGSELTLRSQSRSHQYTQATYGNSEPIIEGVGVRTGDHACGGYKYKGLSPPKKNCKLACMLRTYVFAKRKASCIDELIYSSLMHSNAYLSKL